jgi:rhodanese-related sulfurtransferase
LQELDTGELAALINARTPAVILDARTGRYDDGRRIPGAKSLAPGASAEEAAKRIPAKDALVVTYCANPKCPASDRLARRLVSLGYTNVREYRKGIEGWAAAGQKVVKAK